jgi:hypothetical protein
MEYTRQVIENTMSIEHIDHIYVCTEEERENTLTIIKATHPGSDIECIRTGFRVKEIRKKSEQEKNEWIKFHPIVKKSMDKTWEQEVANVTKKKSR